jgi:hypothetical protein
MLLADAVAVDDDELAIGRNREACRLRELLRRDRDGVGRAVPFVVPHDTPKRRLFLIVRQIAALGL